MGDISDLLRAISPLNRSTPLPNAEALPGFLRSASAESREHAADHLLQYAEQCIAADNSSAATVVLGLAIPELEAVSRESLSRVLCSFAEASLDVGSYSVGLTAAVRAAGLADQTRDAAQSIRARVLASWGHRCLAEYGEAERALNEARVMLCDSEVPVNAGHTVILATGNLHMSRGEYREALEQYDLLLLEPDELTEKVRVKCAINRASALSMMHRYGDSEIAFMEAAQLCRVADRPVDAAIAEHNRAIVRNEMGMWEAGLQSCRLARDLLALVQSDGLLGQVSVTEARSLAGLARFDEAAQLLEAARPTLAANGMSLEVAKVDLNLAEIQVMQGDWRRALATLDRAHREYCELGLRHGPALCELWRGHALLLAERWHEAAAQLERASARLEDLEQGLNAVEALVFAAEAWQRALDDTRALECARGATELLSSAIITAGAMDWTEVGVRRRVPDPHGMIATLLFGPERDELLRSPDMQGATLDEIALACERGRSARLRADLSRMNQVSGNCAASDSSEGPAAPRALVPGRRLAAIGPSSTIRDVLECAPNALTWAGAGLLFDVPSLAEVACLCRDDEGFIAYYAFREDLVAVALDSRGTAGAWLMRSARMRTRPICERFRSLVAQWDHGRYRAEDDADWTSVLQDAGDLLTMPLTTLGWLSGPDSKRRICFVPSAELYDLPMAALGTGSECYVPMVDLVDVAVSPQLGRRSAWSAREATGIRLRGVFDPEGTLPGARMEARSIQAVIPDAVLKVGPEQSTGVELGWLMGGSHAHVACHGVFDPVQPFDSGLFLASSLEEPKLTSVRDLIAADARLDVMFANACQTGMTSVLVGDALYGLVRAMLAVAHTAVCTSWSVDDKVAASIAADFYDNLAQDDDPVRALSVAQRSSRTRVPRAAIPDWAAYQAWC